MNELKVVSINGQLVTESREVANMIGRQHNELMKSIRTYIDYLAKGNFAHGDFFIKSTYKDKNNQTRPCFLLTKKGCEMIANKLTGEKGVLFTAAYVTRFNEMENKQPKVLSNKEQLVASMKLTIETAEEVDEIKEDVKMLKDTMRIDSREENMIRTKANKVVVEALGGKKSHAYKTMNRKVFSRFWNEFKRYFEVPRYGDIPKKQFSDAMEWINEWKPDTSTRIEIKYANSQLSIEDSGGKSDNNFLKKGLV